MTTATDVRRATRDTEDTYLGGVASGLARHLGLPVLWVRGAFLVSAALGGAGVAFYAGLWMVLPADSRFSDEAPGLASATRAGRRPGVSRRLADVGPVVAFGAVGLGLLLLVEGIFGRGALFWPLLLGGLGLAVLWRQADEAQRERWLDTTGRIDPVRLLLGRGGWASYARIAAGLGLLFGGLALFALRSGEIGVARDVLIAAVLGIAGLALTMGPWMFRLASDLAEERAERVRNQERADVAAHLHDSVLQTLALIQKNSAEPATVARLARAQERDLRSWLFSDDHGEPSTVAGALRAAAAEVEDAHEVTVDVVSVGDHTLDDHLRPVVLAAREAMANAARHAGTGAVDVYAEVTSVAVEVFVRDRGVGFDPDHVAADRLGVRRSILDRMRRHGGRATIRSATGDGTEVRLLMPLSQGIESQDPESHGAEQETTP